MCSQHGLRRELVDRRLTALFATADPIGVFSRIQHLGRLGIRSLDRAGCRGVVASDIDIGAKGVGKRKVEGIVIETASEVAIADNGVLTVAIAVE